MPHLKQMLMASIYGLANLKCKDLEATVARFAYIDKLSNEVADQTGDRPLDSVLAPHILPEDGSFVDHRARQLSHRRRSCGATGPDDVVPRVAGLCPEEERTGAICCADSGQEDGCW